MLTTIAILMLALSGFTLSWSSSPSRIENTGSAEVSVIISEDDLLKVSSDSGFIVSYEISATIDGENFIRQSNSLTNTTFPVSEVLSYNSLVEGQHVVTVTLTDLESGSANINEIELTIDAVDFDLWSSSGLRITPSDMIRSSTLVKLLWSVYLPLPQSDLEVNPQAAYALLNEDAEVVLEGWLTGESVESGIVSYKKDISKPLIVQYSYENDDATEKMGDLLLIDPMLLGKTTKNPFKLEDREYPVDYSYPNSTTYMATINIPDGYTIDNVPKPRRIYMPNKSASFVYSIQQSNNKIIVISRFIVKKTTFLPEEYQYLKEFYNQIIDTQDKKIVLKKI